MSVTVVTRLETHGDCHRERFAQHVAHNSIATQFSSDGGSGNAEAFGSTEPKSLAIREVIIVVGIPSRRNHLLVAEQFKPVAMKTAIQRGFEVNTFPHALTVHRRRQCACGFILVRIGCTIECLTAKVFHLTSKLQMPQANAVLSPCLKK